MIVTLAGHVDHGKTAIVQALTGVNTDRLEEEQRRGLTIDLGFAYHDFNGHRVGFVDVPGHRKFIHNMIAGVSKLQFALLVVAANDGVMPQTREHISILELLGLQDGIVALNKVDLVDAMQLAAIKQQLKDYLESTFLSPVPIVEVSARTGKGIPELHQEISTAAKLLDRHQRERATRVAIDRSFTFKGTGSIVTGTIYDGSISTGDNLVVPRTGRSIRIRSLVINGQDSEFGEAGDRCGIQISGVQAREIQRGDWFRDLTCVHSTQHLTVNLKVLPDFPRSITKWINIHVYHGTSHTEAKLFPLEGQLSPGNLGLVDLHCSSSLQAVVGDRIIVRDRDLARSLGGGTIISTETTKARRTAITRTSKFRTIAPLVELDDVQSVLEHECNERCIKGDSFRRRWNLTENRFTKYVNPDRILNLADYHLSAETQSRLSAEIENNLRDYHSETPSKVGLSSSAIAARTNIDPETLKFVLEYGTMTGLFRRRGGQYALFEHRPSVPNYNQALYEQVVRLVDSDQPKALGEIARELKLPINRLTHEMQRLVLAKMMVKINEKRFFTPSRVLDLARLVVKLSNRGAFSVAEFRDASNLGRMVGIDILEYFDKIRFTRRIGNVRELVGQLDLFDKSSG